MARVEPIPICAIDFFRSILLRTALFLGALLAVLGAATWLFFPVTPENAPSDPALVAEGRTVFQQRCSACHGARTGGNAPALRGLIGRQAGTTGFANSPALRSAGFVWDADRLDAFLKDPRGVIPNNQMAFFGLQDPEERAAVIAYVTSL